MITPPKDRVEVVLSTTEDFKIHMWAQSSAERAKLYEYDQKKSLQILLMAGCFLLLMVIFARAAIVILLLLGVIVFFPLYLVGIAGFWLER